VYRSLGATQPVFMSCPVCSYLVEGTCVVCQDPAEHPGCQYCEDGEYKPPKPSWYRSEIAGAIITGTIVVVTASVLGAYIQRWIGLRKK